MIRVKGRDKTTRGGEQETLVNASVLLLLHCCFFFIGCCRRDSTAGRQCPAGHVRHGHREQPCIPVPLEEAVTSGTAGEGTTSVIRLLCRCRQGRVSHQSTLPSPSR